jgi:4-hydroxybenzoate polyprenyltransferase
MTSLEVFWFVLSATQVAFASLVLAALITWRGEHLWPARGRALAPWPTLLAAALFALAFAAMLRVDDVEFSRYLGTGALMLVGLVVAVTLARRGRAGPA